MHNDSRKKFDVDKHNIEIVQLHVQVHLDVKTITNRLPFTFNGDQECPRIVSLMIVSKQIIRMIYGSKFKLLMLMMLQFLCYRCIEKERWRERAKERETRINVL